MATTYNWRSAGGGAIDDLNNWTPASVPVAGDTAVFAQSGGTLSGSVSTSAAMFVNAGWTLTGQLTADTASIDNANVDIDGSGQLVVNGPFAVALSAAPAFSLALTASNGGLLEVTGSAPSSFGAAMLTVAARGIVNLNGGVYFGRNGAGTQAVIDAGVLAVGGLFQLGASSGGYGQLTVQDGGQAVISAPSDPTMPYLQIGAAYGSTGYVSVDGASSLLIAAVDSGSVGTAGTGTLSVTGGGSARFNTTNNGANPALTIGQLAGSTGTAGISGAGSSLIAHGSIVVGGAGSGTLRVLGGASATALGYTDAQAALAVAASVGGTGTLVIDGGSSLVASGPAVVGGDNRGSGLGAGGRANVVVTNGSTLQTNSMTILAGSLVALDASSQEVISGTLVDYGTLSTRGTLTITGALLGTGTLQIGGGLTSIGSLSNANVSFTGSSGSLRVSGVVGTSIISGLQPGDVIDLVGIAAGLSGSTVTTATGNITLGANPGGQAYAIGSDGNGGTFVSLSPSTIGVYRFFDSNYGTHFFSSSSSEKNAILSTRPDLLYEGVGLQSIDTNSNDPNGAPVFRFFDSSYGTHFFTASASERDTVIKTRPDLLYEGVGFVEHTVQQAGDVGVYRFFDTHYGTHFYTADANERAMIVQTRPDLIDEGIGFYAPK